MLNSVANNFRNNVPTGHNSFVLTYIFTEKSPRRIPKRVHAPLREILDPPLLVPFYGQAYFA